MWAKHRVPSWCDRVLYLCPPFEGTKPTIHRYESLPLQGTSDHQPVLMSFSVPIKPIPRSLTGSGGDGAEDWISAPFPINPGWRADRLAARQRELAVGFVAYLATTWEGRALLLGTVVGGVGAWALVRSLLI